MIAIEGQEALVIQDARGAYTCYILCLPSREPAYSALCHSKHLAYECETWGSDAVLLTLHKCHLSRKALLHTLLPTARLGGCMIYIPLNVCSHLPKRCISDLDGTLIRNELLIDLARNIGLDRDFERITEQTISGSLDFADSLRLRTKQLGALHLNDMEALLPHINLAPGLNEWLDWCQSKGIALDLATGNFSPLCEYLRQIIPFESYCASAPEIKDERLTGSLLAIVDSEAKAHFAQATAQRHHLTLDQLLAIGDGANDLALLDTVGHACLYNGYADEGEESIAFTRLIDLIMRHINKG